MPQEIKYTSDGRKVVVIGSLNSQEKIVQEIFVVDGSEIPSGEHFVVKSLHDAPAVSWKENNLKKLEERYEAESKRITIELDRLKKVYSEKVGALKSKIDYVGSVLKNVSPDSFELLVDYLTGNIKWVVELGYSPQLIEFSEFEKMCEGKLRLISIYGLDDGTLTYAQGRYYDYSGYSGSETRFIPFTNYEDALERLKNEILSRDLDDYTFPLLKKYGIEAPREAIDKYRKNKIQNLKMKIDGSSQQLQKWQEELNSWEAL